MFIRFLYFYAAGMGVMHSFAWAFLPDHGIVDYVGSLVLFVVGITYVIAFGIALYRWAEVCTIIILEKMNYELR